MKDTRRALRRHHRQRMIARTMRLLASSRMPEEDRLQWVLRLYKNRQRCSCYMCGHRRKYDGPTVQERRQPPAEELCARGKVSVLATSFDVILCDILPDLALAWQRAFAPYPEVAVQRGDLLEVEADAYVSPANSYGMMDGGLDAVLKERFPDIESQVQGAIAAVGRLLPVGQALVVETGDPDVPYLICAPTMEVPSRVGHTSNAFRAMLALLSAIEQFNTENGDAIGSVVIPGLCTGVGDMEPETAALQMARAYAEWRNPL